MGGVDLHGQYCNDLKINIKSNKWTWQIFPYIIESALSNYIILWNTSVEENQRVSAQDFDMNIADNYLRRE